jgi:hypothetical protein
MASTYSTSLKLTLIGDGDQSGIWGQTTNTNLGTLLEQAITGVVSVNMADANYTLTSFNGVTDEARNAVIVATGTNNGVRDLIPPVLEKLYTVSNQTTGGYAIRVIGTSGTGVTIPNGVTTLVYCNGTNFYSGLSGTSGNFTVTGDIAVTGNAAANNVTVTNTLSATNIVASNATFVGGTVNVPTVANSSNTTVAASTAFVKEAVTSVTSTLGTMSTQNANNVIITGGTINSTTQTGGTYTNATLNNATISSVSTAITAAQGGTGVTTPGTSGNVLTSNGSAWTSAAPVLTKYYTSGNQSGPTSSGTAYTISHTLGVVPKITRLVAVCTTASGGYAVGDEIELVFSNGTNGNMQAFCYSNASVIVYWSGPYIYINDAGNGSLVNLINNSNFAFKIYVFA